MNEVYLLPLLGAVVVPGTVVVVLKVEVLVEGVDVVVVVGLSKQRMETSS